MHINNILEKLIGLLELGHLTNEPVRIFGGLLNKMYKVDTTSGVYAIKHLNPELIKKEGAIEGHILAESIANKSKENNISCIPGKIIKNKIVHENNGNYFIVYDWFDGHIIKNTEVTLEHIKKIAIILAQIHNVDYGELQSKCIYKPELELLDWDFYIPKIQNEQIKSIIENRKNELIEFDKVAIKNALEIQNNKVISHKDIDLPNVLWDDNTNPVIIDWELSGLVNPAEEVVETAWDWSGGPDYFDFKKYNYFLKIYKDNNGDLSDYEKALHSRFKNQANWLEYNLKRACRIECVDDEEHEIGEKVVIDVLKDIFTFNEIIKNIANI